MRIIRIIITIDKRASKCCLKLTLKGFVMKKTVNAVLVAGTVGICGAVMALNAMAQQQVLNLYSSRHYQTDEALYANFEKSTGIKVNRIEGPEDPLIERMKSEGDKSPADLLEIERASCRERVSPKV